MAQPQQQEALRAVQNTLSLHKIIRRSDASETAMERVLPASVCACLSRSWQIAPRRLSGDRMADCAALAGAVGVAVDVLVRRRWLGSAGIRHES